MVYSINDPLPAYIQQGVQRLLGNQQLNNVERNLLQNDIEEIKNTTTTTQISLLQVKEMKLCSRKTNSMSANFDRLVNSMYLISLKNSQNEDEALIQTVDMMTDIMERAITAYAQYDDDEDTKQDNTNPFTCQYCKELLYQPVTLSCGHSFCQCCVDSILERYQSCATCGKEVSKDQKCKVNVTLMTILQKFHATEWEGRSLVVQGIHLLQKKQYQEALEQFTQALNKVPYSHVAYLYRAKAFMMLHKLNLALEDCTKAVFLSRRWAEAYFVKGEILRRMSFIPHSFISLLMGLFLEPCRSGQFEQLKQMVKSTVARCEKQSAGSRMPTKRRHLSCSPPLTRRNQHSQDPPSPPLPPVKRRRLSETCTSSSSSSTAVANNSSSLTPNGWKETADTVYRSDVDTSTSTEETTNSSSSRTNVCKAAARCWFHTSCNRSSREKRNGRLSWITFSNDNNANGSSNASPMELPDSPTLSVRTSPTTSEHDTTTTETSISCGGKSTEVGGISEQSESDFISFLFTIDKKFTGDLTMICDSSLNRKLIHILGLATRPQERSEFATGSLEKIEPVDFECSLCMRLFYDPVCTMCGHVFCQRCLERCLDHTLHCPLCKQPLHEYLADSLRSLHHPSDYATEAIIKKYFTEAYSVRKAQHLQEVEEITQSQPIFVCTIAFPSVPCPLHIFEPRYRLMLRRCLDHNQRSFGMCMPLPNTQHHSIGTLLKVRNVTFFPDGRSIVDCIGFRRFKTSHSQMIDGYHVAKLQIIEDTIINDEQTLERLVRIHEKVFVEAQEWFKGLTSTVAERIVNHFGAFPTKDNKLKSENGPDWLWWVLAVIPVENRVKATILGKNSLRERLLIIHRIFVCLAQRPRSDTRS